MAIFTHLAETFPELAPAPAIQRETGCGSISRRWEQVSTRACSGFITPSYYGPNEPHDAIRDFALIDIDRLLDYLQLQLDPYLAGAAPMASDFYLFMIILRVPDKDRVRSGRPKIAAFIDAMRYHPVVDSVNLDRETSRGA